LVSDKRLLLEVYLCETPVFVRDVAANVEIGTEAVRQRLEKLESGSLVEVSRSNDVSIYRLSEAGVTELSKTLREKLS
jgi:predicted ArsR family transcriptional regulator